MHNTQGRPYPNLSDLIGKQTTELFFDQIGMGPAMAGLI